MIIVGAHYLPFIRLYGMRMFGALAGILALRPLVFAHLTAAPFAAGGWFTGLTLLVFAVPSTLRPGGAAPATTVAG